MKKKKLKVHKNAKVPKDINLDVLIANAVSAMAFAIPRRSNCRVGAALLDTKNTIYTGANIEFRYQQSWHAEETAISTCKTHDGGDVRCIVVAADRKLFTPCGRCMDPIMEFCRKDAFIIYYNPRTKKKAIFTLNQLMPFYPSKGD